MHVFVPLSLWASIGDVPSTILLLSSQVTYVVLESQYQSSLTKACQAINDSRDDVCVECVGYLLEELRDDANLAAFKADVETSNIFIGSLIFVQAIFDPRYCQYLPRAEVSYRSRMLRVCVYMLM